MTAMTRIQRVRARLDRLPAGWLVILAGFLLQLGVAVGLLTLAVTGVIRLSTIAAAAVLVITVVAGVVTVPSVLLLRHDRYPRAAATLAALVGVATLVVSEAHPSVSVYPVALLVAAVRVWAGYGLDVVDLLRLDPGRFERLDPPRDPESPTDRSEERSGDGSRT
jgi:hypothetical protein